MKYLYLVKVSSPFMISPVLFMLVHVLFKSCSFVTSKFIIVNRQMIFSMIRQICSDLGKTSAEPTGFWCLLSDYSIQVLISCFIVGKQTQDLCIEAEELTVPQMDCSSSVA